MFISYLQTKPSLVWAGYLRPAAPGMRVGEKSGLNQIPIPSLLPVADLNYKLAEEHVPALVSVEKSKAVTMLSDVPAFAY